MKFLFWIVWKLICSTIFTIIFMFFNSIFKYFGENQLQSSKFENSQSIDNAMHHFSIEILRTNYSQIQWFVEFCVCNNLILWLCLFIIHLKLDEKNFFFYLQKIFLFFFFYFYFIILSFLQQGQCGHKNPVGAAPPPLPRNNAPVKDTRPICQG